MPRKPLVVEDSVSETVAAEKPDDAAGTACSTPAEEHYKTGTWKGFPHYRCVFCPFDTLDRNEIEDHVARHRAVSSRSHDFAWFDGFGNLVSAREVRRVSAAGMEEQAASHTSSPPANTDSKGG